MKTKVVFAFILIVALVFPSVASAETGFDACAGDTVSGVVVAVDETTGEITFYTDDGTFCTVVKNLEEYDHPVIDLLGQYFEKVSLEELAQNLDALQAWVVFDDATTTWDFATEGDVGAVPVTIVGAVDNLDGTYLITFLAEGETEPQTVLTTDAALYQAYLDGLLGSTVALDLLTDEAGNTFVSDGAVEIGAYHDDGMGLGVLVKLYAMSEAYGVPVDELVARFKDGEGLGQLFKDEELGKPELLGVGHVYDALGANPGHPDGKNNPSVANKANNPGKGHKNK